LVEEPENTTDRYDRDLFQHWVDADGDGCDTRCEVLLEERKGELPGLPSGGWLSIYDGYSTDDSSELDIDHMVPLAEAFESGAWGWDANRRREFANDLLEPASLIAVTAATNRSKGAKDPAEWQPPNTDAWCVYVENWVRVKLRWDLSADTAELAALRNMAARCDATPESPLPADPVPSTPGTGEELYYATCAQARADGNAPLLRGSPGYRSALDRDGDGVACE
jgi:hypothetical protein